MAFKLDLLFLLTTLMITSRVSSNGNDSSIKVVSPATTTSPPPATTSPPPAPKTTPPPAPKTTPPPAPAPAPTTSPPPVSPPSNHTKPSTPSSPPKSSQNITHVDVKECPDLCLVRCAKHSRPNVCHRACGSCCKACKCVPPGTYGNREMCGSCYTDMKTHGNRTKCP